MAEFDASDIVEVAIRIEENGAAFYRTAAGNSRNGKVKDLFAHLAEEEEKHGKIFTELRATLTPALPPAGDDELYAAYLNGYVDHILVFNEEGLARELKKVIDDASAFDFAIQREFDSILYYHEIRGIIRAEQWPVVEEIIAEERKHFTLLTEMKRALNP